MLDLRIFRSFHAKYYEDDILHGPTGVSGCVFRQLVEHGFNAVWLRGILRDLATTDVFPDAGRGDRAPPGCAGDGGGAGEAAWRAGAAVSE